MLADAAWADPYSNPYGQMRRQKQLVDQTRDYGITKQEELRHKSDAEADIDRALRNYSNQLD